MENKIININSVFRDKNKYPNANHFRIVLEEKLKNIIYIRMSSLEMVDINYVFSNQRNNNKFNLIIGDTNHLIDIEEGNYTSSTLIIKLQEILDVINATIDFQIRVDIEISTAKIFFTTEPENEITIDFTRVNNTKYNGINYYFGFKNLVNTGTLIKADSVINISGFNYAFLNINDYDNVIDSQVSNVFTKIIYESGRFNALFSNGAEFNSKDLVFRSPIDISYFEIKILDYMGSLLELNQSDFSLTLEVGYIYDWDLYKKINNFGKPNGDTRLLYKY